MVLWARLELSALNGKLEKNRGGEAMNLAKSRVPWARIRPIQAISLLSSMIEYDYGNHADAQSLAEKALTLARDQGCLFAPMKTGYEM